jgi:two-component system sensor histidine kinase SenX3
VRLEAMRTDFVANISHELRTPVGALALLAETLQGEREPETIDRLAGKLEIEALRVSNMIDDLLELSRIEVEGARRDRVPVEAVIGEAVDRVHAAAEQRGIVIEKLRPDEPSVVAGDRQQLVSALTNLVDNAVKYSERGGRVTVSEVREGDEIVLTVADEGMGIPDRDLDRVFERFYRVDRARSRTTGGTGLGLAIVRHVADNHGGSIGVSSREGVGSTFTLRLPAWEQHQHRSVVVRPVADLEATP